MEVNFHFWPTGERSVRIRAVPNHYNHSVKTAVELGYQLKEKLKEIFPQGHEVVVDPEIHILGGIRNNGQMSVGIVITVELSSHIALGKKLTKAGFYNIDEPLLG